jgi:hypothetical protein
MLDTRQLAPLRFKPCLDFRRAIVDNQARYWFVFWYLPGSFFGIFQSLRNVGELPPFLTR